MNPRELIDYTKDKPYLVGGAAAASVGVVAWVWWQGRGGDAPARASQGVVGDKTAIDSGYPGIIVNQPAPTPTPPAPLPKPGGSTNPPTPAAGKKYADSPVDTKLFPQYSCPIGSKMAYEKRKGTRNETTGNIVCQRADGTQFPVSARR